MNYEEEMLDLIDKDDNIIGAIERHDINGLFENPVGYVRYAECFIQNSSGRLWIPRRHLSKRIVPGGLDFSASEHVAAGEDYLTAIVRGLEEEFKFKNQPFKLRKNWQIKSNKWAAILL